MHANAAHGAHKVAEVTLLFWVVKIAATTLGETGGDFVTMSMQVGYLVGTLIFGALFLVLVGAQIAARRFRPLLYWSVIVASTTAGTTLADFADRSLGIGYAGGSLLLAALLATALAVWYRAAGSVAMATVTTRRIELFYWLTIMFSQTLGTALGDWAAAQPGLGYAGAALLFGAGLAGLAMLYAATTLSRTLLFWSAFILTRPLGATIADFLDKPTNAGGLMLSRLDASAVLATFIIMAVLLMTRRPATRLAQ